MNNKPCNLLIQAFILGASSVFGSNPKTIEQDLDQLAKKFGYNSLVDFDKHFPEESH